MNETSIKKEIILNGSESIAVFKQDGLVYKTAEINSYTPIVFKNLKANVKHQFDLSSVITKDYKVMSSIADVKDDDDVVAVAEQDANNMNYPGGYFTLLKNGKRIYSRYTQFTGGEFNYTQFLISADNGITIQPNKNINTLTFLCVPVYVESSIVVPEVISNEQVILEPQPEPQPEEPT